MARADPVCRTARVFLGRDALLAAMFLAMREDSVLSFILALFRLGDLVGEREILTFQNRCQLRGMHPVVFGNRVREFPDEFLLVEAKDRRMSSGHGEVRWPVWKGLQSAAKRILPHRENLMQYTLVINLTSPCRCGGAC